MIRCKAGLIWIDSQDRLAIGHVDTHKRLKQRCAKCIVQNHEERDPIGQADQPDLSEFSGVCDEARQSKFAAKGRATATSLHPYIPYAYPHEMSDAEHCGQEYRKPEGLVEVPSDPCTSLLMQGVDSGGESAGLSENARYCIQVVMRPFETINVKLPVSLHRC